MKGDGSLLRSKSKNSEDSFSLRQANLRSMTNLAPISRLLLGRMRMGALICQQGNISYAPYGFYLPLSSSPYIRIEKELIHSVNLEGTTEGG